MRRNRMFFLFTAALLLLTNFLLLSGCTQKKSELEAYLEAAYPGRSFSEDGRYFIRRPDGSRFAVETENHEEKTGIPWACFLNPSNRRWTPPAS